MSAEMKTIVDRQYLTICALRADIENLTDLNIELAERINALRVILEVERAWNDRERRALIAERKRSKELAKKLKSLGGYSEDR